jgi:hypothetical protein
MEVAEAVVNVFDFIDQLNYIETTDGQHSRNSAESRGHKRLREVDICDERVVSSEYVEQFHSQPLRWNYMQRARKRAAAPAESATEASLGATAGDNVLVGSSSGRAAAAATALIGHTEAGTAKEATAVLVGNESTAAVEEIAFTGKLSRKQAKNCKQRMNQMKVLSCPSN